jgi:alkaline phosphatase D
MARCNSELDSTANLSLSAGGTEQILTSSALAAKDFTVSFLAEGLESGTTYTYTVQCAALDGSLSSESAAASFKTAPGPDDAVDVSFVWAADLAGQGWGRNPDLSITTVDGQTITGGYVIFDVIAATQPDFAIFQGDMIYADNAIPPSKEIPAEVGGGNWTNNPSKDFAAVTLDEFRANWKYNFGDAKMESFLAQTPVYVQWDDHEVTNVSALLTPIMLY